MYFRTPPPFRMGDLSCAHPKGGEYIGKSCKTSGTVRQKYPMSNSCKGSIDGDAGFGNPDRRNCRIRRQPHTVAYGMISAGDIIFTGRTLAK